MSPIQTNTQKGNVILPAASDFTANIGCFATINSSAQAALPTSHGLALYVVTDAFLSGGVYYADLYPLWTSDRNVRVISSAAITAAANVTTDAAGKAVPASTGNNILGIAEETGVSGQYVLIRPIGGISVM